VIDPDIGAVCCQDTLKPTEPGAPSDASNPLTNMEPPSELQLGFVIVKVGVIGGGCVMITVVEVWQLLKSLTVITYVPEDKLDIVYVPPPIEHEEEVERISAGQDNPNPEGGDVGPVQFKLYPRQDPAEEGPTVPPQKFSVICPVF
jgi:hypothetical protein